MDVRLAWDRSRSRGSAGLGAPAGWVTTAVVAAVLLAGCATTGGPADRTGAGPAGAGAGAASTGLVAEDPAHGVVQPFPPPGSCTARPVAAGMLPDRRCTPGAVDPHVTQATLGRTVCRPGGYTGSVRPPEAVTRVEKRRALAAYSDTGPASAFELDHLVPLSLGGTPNSSRNLWPEPGSSPNPKDKLEGALHDLVCAGRLPLASAQQMLATDWVTGYRQTLGRNPTPAAAP